MDIFSRKGAFLGNISPEALLKTYFPVNEKAAALLAMLGPDGYLMLEYQRILRKIETRKFAKSQVQHYSRIDWLEDLIRCVRSGEQLYEYHPLFPFCPEPLEKSGDTVNPSLDLKNLLEAARACILDSNIRWQRGNASTHSFRRLRKLYGQIKGILGGDEAFQEYQWAYLHYLRTTQESDFLAYETAKLTIDFLDKTLEIFWKEANPDAV